jgi:hypothetical protein
MNKSLEKSLYKIVLYSVKVIPMVIAGIYLLNTTLSYFNIDLPILSYIVMFLLIIGLYLLSITFCFCKWHRMFIHYISCNLILNIVDYYIGIPVSDKKMFIIYLIVTGLFMFLILYYHVKSKKISC